jgi:hypothetical protein
LSLTSFTDEDLELLRAVARQFKRRRADAARYGLSDAEAPSPPMLVCLTPFDGVPGLKEPGSTTGTGTGTGTATEEALDRPGEKVCDVYRKLPDSVTGRSVMRKCGFTVKVTNLNHRAVLGAQFVTVHQDRFGDWYIPSMGLIFAECP